MIDRDDLKFFKNIIDLNNKDTKYKTLDDVVFSMKVDDRYGFLYSICLLYTSPSPRDVSSSRMPSSA